VGRQAFQVQLLKVFDSVLPGGVSYCWCSCEAVVVTVVLVKSVEVIELFVR